jgi:tetratricopeptide (TPR) repeat protein
MSESDPMSTNHDAALTLDEAVRAVAARLTDREPGDAVRRRLDEARGAAPVSRKDAIECARALMGAGLIDEAEMLFEALARRHPGEPPGPVGLAQIAMRRQSWTEALSRWDAVLAAFAPRREAFWVAGRAQVLNELDRAEEAADLYVELIGDASSAAQGYAGLAHLAMRRRDWPSALAHWDEVLMHFPKHPNAPFWRTSRATVLLEFGRGDEAEATLRELVRADPGELKVFLPLLQLLVATGRHEEALSELEASAFGAVHTAGLVGVRFNSLIRLKRLEAARAEYELSLAAAEEPAMLASLFAFTPELYEGWPRTAAWLALREKLERLGEADEGRHAPATEVLRLRLDLALRDHGAFVTAMARLGDDVRLGVHDRKLRAVARTLGEASYPDWRKQKVFGIGLSKTGTTTVALALTMLGLNTVDFTNPLTMELMSEDDLHIFDAFTDTPVCAGFEKYFYLFPNAKFIYTSRPVESWEESMLGQWQRHYGLADFNEVRAEFERPDRFHHGVKFRDINHILFTNHESLSQAHRAYDLRVRSFFANKPPESFLEFDLFGGHGWPQLCAFLGAPAPDQPFPWQNRDPLAPEETET